MARTAEGLHRDMYVVKRSDGKDEPGAKYFVLRYDRNKPWDNACRNALLELCEEIKTSYPKLAEELAQEVDDYTYVPISSKKWSRMTDDGKIRCVTPIVNSGSPFHDCFKPATLLIERSCGIPLGEEEDPKKPPMKTVHPACEPCAAFWRAASHVTSVKFLPIENPDAVIVRFCMGKTCKSGSLAYTDGFCPECIERIEEERKPKKSGRVPL